MLALAVLVGAGAYLFFSYASPQAVRGLTERRLAALTGREVSIAGDFDYAYSLTPTFTARKLAIANADWGTHSDMLVAEQVEVELAILPLLLRGDVEIDRFILERAEIFIERGPEGRLNWQFDAPAGEAGSSSPEEGDAEKSGGQTLAVRALSVVDSTVVWRGEGGDSEPVLLERLSWRRPASDDALVLEANGRYGQNDFAVSGTLGTPQALTASTPSPIDLEAQFGSARLVAEGQIDFPLGGGATDVALVLTGEGDALLSSLSGRGLAGLGAWQLAAEVTAGEHGLRAADLAARAALPGDLTVAVAGGSVDRLLEGDGIALPVTAEAPSLEGVAALTQTELPALGAFRAEGRLVGSVEHLSLEQAAGWLGPAEDDRLVEVTGGRIDNVIEGSGLDLELRAAGSGRALVAWWDRAAALDELTATARLTGDLASPGLDDFDAGAMLNDARVQVSGSIGNVAAPAQLDLQVSAEGPSLAALAPLAGGGLPATGPFSLAGRLTGGAEAVTVENLSARLGQVQAQGRLQAALPDDDVPRLEGDLSFAEIDLDTVLAYWPQGVEAGTAAQAESPPLDLPWLEAFEAVLTLRAEALVIEGTRFTDISTGLRLQDGRLAVNDLTARAASGTMRADATLDAAGQPAAEVVLRLQADDIELARLIDGATPGRVQGELDIDLNVDATGRTLDEIAANLEGDAALFGEEGELQDVPLHRMVPDLDIARILPFFWKQDSKVRVNCVIGEFDIENGVARTDSMLDTQRMTLLGSGAVDLGEGRLDLTLRPVTKSRKLSSSAVPVDIEGPLDDPEIRPRVGEAAGGALRGFLGGLLVPLNQITALFGSEAKDACAGALQQAREGRGEAGGAN